jgi:hypothetical protein
VQCSGNYLYLGMTKYLDVLDLTNPISPIYSSSVNLQVVSLERNGNVLHASTFDDHLVTLDISDASQPKILASLTLSDLPARVHVFGNLLHVADATAGLLIYDVSTPASEPGAVRRILSTVSTSTFLHSHCRARDL